MDGSFVPNYTLGTDFCKTLRNATDIPLDIHLMIDRPEDKPEWFGAREGEYLDSSGHSEIEVDGNVSFENARRMSDEGANIFVAGTSSIFSPDFSLGEGIARLRESIK